MTDSDLRKIYEHRHDDILIPMRQKLENYLLEILKDQPRIDRVSLRVKSVESFLEKAEKMVGDQPKYHEPLKEIHDQIGARIIAFYNCDLDPVCKYVERYFRPVEKDRKEPVSKDEFGYEGYHYLFFIPLDFIDQKFPKEDYPEFFELQIRTLFQHAWAQANHDLVYKPTTKLTREQLRKVAFTAAQSWGADKIFEELFKELSMPNN
jgi:putative GTP pyrophosphokinase